MTHGSPTSPDTPSIEDRLLAFVRDELLPEGTALDRDTALLSSGVLDSMSVMRLAAFVGDTFNVEVRAADFVIENFSSIAALGGYVRRLKEAGREPPDVRV